LITQIYMICIIGVILHLSN